METGGRGSGTSISQKDTLAVNCLSKSPPMHPSLRIQTTADGLCAIDIGLEGGAPSALASTNIILRAAASIVHDCVAQHRPPVGGIARNIGEHQRRDKSEVFGTQIPGNG